MRVIKEYLLDKNCTSPQTLYLPIDAEPIAVQDTTSGLLLQVLCNFVELNTELRTFKLCSIDEHIYETNIKYIDNFEATFGRCFVLEILKNEN